VSGARDQVGRLLALVPYIQSREDVPLEQAARDFGVKPAQIVQDLHVLWFCGLPGLGMGDLIDVDMEALEDEGVIRVSNADYLRRPLRLDSTEASALIVALRALREGGDAEVRPVVDRALAKLEAAAGEGAQLAARVDVHLPEDESDLVHLRGRLERAVRERRQVRLGYYVPARDESTLRTVDPIALVTGEGHTYLDAWCHVAEGQRLFRLDRVSEAAVLESPAAEHPDVTPRDLSEVIFSPADDALLVTLDLAPEARWVAEYYPVESTEETGDRLRVRMRASDPTWMARLVLRLGGAATVVEPAGLRADVGARAAEALRNYGRADVRWT
jgi:proteasome accessory factor C